MTRLLFFLTVFSCIALENSNTAYAFSVFLSMWTQGQVYVLNSGQKIELDCEFYAEEYSMFNNPVIWKKFQRQEQADVNIMGNVLPPFFDTGRFNVELVSRPPRYTLKLRISELALQDSGNYTCEVRGPKSAVMATVTHYIFIRAPVRRLYLSDSYSHSIETSRSLQPTSVNFIENSTGQLRCTSIGGYPPPEIQVFIGDRDITSLFSLFTSATLDGSKGLRLMVYQLDRWTERLVLGAADDGKLIRCVATVSGLPPNSTSTQVNVKYRPIINCLNISAAVGDKNVHLKCEVQSRPGLTSLFWTVDGNGTTVVEGKIIDQFWTLVMDRPDGLMETHLFMRETNPLSFRKYTVHAENAIAASTVDVWLIKKTGSAAAKLPMGGELLIKSRTILNSSNRHYHHHESDTINPKYVLFPPSSFASSSSSSASASSPTSLSLYLYCSFSALVCGLHGQSFKGSTLLSDFWLKVFVGVTISIM